VLLELVPFGCDSTTVGATNALSGGRSVLNAVSKKFLLLIRKHKLMNIVQTRGL